MAKEGEQEPKAKAAAPPPVAVASGTTTVADGGEPGIEEAGSADKPFMNDYTGVQGIHGGAYGYFDLATDRGSGEEMAQADYG